MVPTTNQLNDSVLRFEIRSAQEVITEIYWRIGFMIRAVSQQAYIAGTVFIKYQPAINIL